MFPTTVFRRAYDALLEGKPAGADKEYLRLLHLAASTSEAEVECAIGLLLDQQQLPTFDAVRELIVKTTPTQAPAIDKGVIDLSGYDRLIPSRSQHGQCAR
ncbi:hypothetical protein [Pandoraea oxalativorans]|uniref:hypothetical protein n=1 Tax=Pandoraea oxalativorans TaxID=573737 RepID=UPI000B1C8256|nr:hypothetical protein [Pandoraea oxalativorans]